jgi:TPR repeat protein
VKKDKQKAKKFYELAAADGDADAQKAVERLSKRFWQFWKPAQEQDQYQWWTYYGAPDRADRELEPEISL